jgi:hypothetical protein
MGSVAVLSGNLSGDQEGFCSVELMPYIGFSIPILILFIANGHITMLEGDKPIFLSKL